MKYVRIFFDHIRNKPTIYFFVFAIIFTIDRHHRLEHHIGPMSPVISDVQEYYSLLPDIFLAEDSAAGARIAGNKRTLGMAVMYAPAFATGHVLAKLNGEPADGYSDSYYWALRWESIIYVLLALAFLRKALLFFFKEAVVAITLACILFGTNLFYYTYGWGEMPHSHLFLLYSIFIWLTLRWIISRKPWALAGLAFVAGFITWIRPTGILVLLFPLLYGITSRVDLPARWKLIVQSRKITVVAIVLFLLPTLVQMLFWKAHMGRFVYYSYRNEHFFFGDPQINNFIFSFRKGWLVYTPIMIFALIGMVRSWSKLKSVFAFSIVFFISTVYLLSCWWDWGFGGSFGCRALVESYAFLAFPFAVTADWFWFNRFSLIPKFAIRIVSLSILFALIRLNMWQTTLYRAGVIHWSGMNKTTYFFTLSKQEFREEDYQYLNDHFTPPDAEAMQRGDRDQ